MAGKNVPDSIRNVPRTVKRLNYLRENLIFDLHFTDMPIIRKHLSLLFPLLLLSVSCQEKAPVQDSPVSQSKVLSPTLSNQSITCFAEDAQGYIWIGTESGLNQYNGSEYVQFFHNEDPASINLNRIKAAFCSSDQTLWVGTASGINALGQDGAFRHYDLPSSSKLLNGIYTWQDELFVTTLGCLLQYDKAEDTFRKCFDLPSSSRIIHVSFSDRTATVFLSGSILAFDRSSGALVRQDPFDGGAVLSVADVGEDTYLATDRQIYRYERHTGRLSAVPGLAFPEIHSILRDDLDPTGLLVVTRTGLFHVYEDYTSVHLASLRTTPYGRNDISTVFVDSRHNIWIGYQNQGYTVIYSYERDSYDSRFRLKRALAGENITSVAEDRKGRIWMISDYDRLLLLEDGRLNTIDLDSAFRRKITGTSSILNLYVDPEDNLWLNIDYSLNRCVYDGRALQVAERHGIIRPADQPISHDDPVIDSYIMTADPQGGLWLGWLNGFVYYRAPQQSTLASFPIAQPDLTHMGGITTLSDGRILCGFHGRDLYVVDPREKRIVEEIPIPEISREHLYITALAEDAQGAIWVGTRGSGVFRVEPDHTRYAFLRDIPCRDVSAIVKDRNDDIWISSYNGLFKYSLRTGNVNTFQTVDGIGGQQFNFGAGICLRSGELLFGGSHGVTIMNPDETRKAGAGGPLHFDELFVNNKWVHPEPGGILEKKFSSTSGIRLNHRQRNLSISFSQQDFGRQSQIRYRYTLQHPRKGKWIDLGDVHKISLDQVPYGRCVLTVESAYPDNPGTVQSVRLRIHVRRPPWLSLAALVLYALCFAAIVGQMIHLSVKLYWSRLDRQALEKANEMDMRFFSNVSHEFRTPLTMVSGAMRQLQSGDSPEDRKRYYDIIGRNTDRMVRLVNQIMDFNKIEADVLRLSVSETDALACIRNTVEDFSFGFLQKHVSMQMSCDLEEIPMWLDEDKLDKILSNILSNALKFTPSGTGVIHLDIGRIPAGEAWELFPGAILSDRSPFLLVQVFNSGSHIPEDRLDYIFGRYNQLEEGARLGGTGVGLYYTHRLAQIHHGAIKAENKTEYDGQDGVAFTFVLPTDEDAYSQEEKQPRSAFRRTVSLAGAPRPEENADPADEQKPLILVIDDDYEVSFYLKSLLSPYYRIRVEQDGTTGYKTLVEIHPDLVLCDVLMPGIDGVQLCRMAKGNLSVCHIPFILLTAKYTVDDQVLGLDSGANAYVIKPFEPDYLLAVIKSQLQNRELMRQRLTHHTAEKEVEETLVNELDKRFVKELYQLMEKSLDQPDMNVTDMCKALGVSRSQLFYKVKALTGETPHAFFNHYKLNIAAKWIMEDRYKFSAIAEDLGFSSASHFTSLFKKEFGCLPSEYKKLHG